MAYRMRRGIGALVNPWLNPTRGTALDCGLFAGGVFQKACWCLQFPSLCSTEDYQAAMALAHPDVYVAVQAPPAVGSPGGAALTVPPASGEQAQETVDGLLAQQDVAWKTQNQEMMAETQRRLEAIAASQPSLFAAGMNWWLWAGIAVATVFALAVVGGGTPRRYGR